MANANSPLPNSRREQQPMVLPNKQKKSRKESYRPPPAGPDFNRRLVAHLQERLRGDVRSQIAAFCEHADFPRRDADIATPLKVRIDTGRVLQSCVTVLKQCGINLQNLSDLSPKNATTVLRALSRRGEHVGSVLWRAAILREYFRMLGRWTPLLAPSSSAY